MGATGDAVKAIVIRGKEWGATGDAVKAIVIRGKEWGLQETQLRQ